MTAFGFRAFHVYEHGDLDRLLLDLVRPALRSLVAERLVDRFFFVRFALGGPHVRLRLRAAEPDFSAVRATIEATANVFFRDNPSTRELPEEQVRRMTEAVLSVDPNERDGAVYANRTVREAPFEPEIDRYGGPSWIGLSLDYFSISSARALRFLASASGAAPRSKQLTWLLRLVVAEALGFADDPTELLSLLASPFAGRENMLGPLVSRGDKLFDEQGNALCRLLSADIGASLEGGAPLGAIDPTASARDFSVSLGEAGASVRKRILESQLHMSANRLGIGNPEEVYLGRAAFRVIDSIFAARPELRASLARRGHSAAGAIDRIAEGAQRAITDLGGDDSKGSEV